MGKFLGNIMTKDDKIKCLEISIEEYNKISKSNDSMIINCGEKAKIALQNIFPNKNYGEKFNLILTQKTILKLSEYKGTNHTIQKFEYNKKRIENAYGYLQAKIYEIKNWPEEMLTIEKSKKSSIIEILRIINRFDFVAKQLRKRHDSRKTLDILDEYDVQDLFHALLKLYFDDIRTEEWPSSYAGSSSRIDFFIPELELAIEMKKTCKGLGNKEAKEQLAIDKDCYRCKVKHLICFVYDPDCKIQNSRGFEKDLAQEGPLKTNVYVRQ